MTQPHTMIGVFFMLLGITFMVVQIILFMNRDRRPDATGLSWLDTYTLYIVSLSLTLGGMFYGDAISSMSPIGLWIMVIGLNASIATYVLRAFEKAPLVGRDHNT